MRVRSLIRAAGSQPALTLILVSLAGTAQAQQQLTFADAGNSDSATVTDDGSRVAFRSSANLDDDTGNASGVSNVFVVNSDGSDLIRLTDLQQSARSPVISGDGNRVVFVSSGNPTGDNPDGSTELFAVDADGGGLAQITDTGVTSDIRAPALPADGSRIAFSASSDLLQDGSNSDGSREIFAIDVDGDNLTQITGGPATTTSRFPDITGSDDRIVFYSNADPAGDNSDGNSEIFIADSDGGGEPEQLTDADTGLSRHPSIAGNGRVAFESSADLDDADGGNFEIFTVDANGGSPRQITETTGSDATNVRIAGNGEHLVFQSGADFTGNNDDGSREIFLVASDGSDADQLTDSRGDSTQPGIAMEGERVVFQSSADLTGNNGDLNSEIFVVDPSPDDTGDNDDDGDSFFCSEGSGCAFCSNGDNDDTVSATRAPADPTLALLTILAVIRIVRRSRPL